MVDVHGSPLLFKTKFQNKKTSRDFGNRGWSCLKTLCANWSAPGCRTSPRRSSGKEEAVGKGEVKECSRANHASDASSEA